MDIIQETLLPLVALYVVYCCHPEKQCFWSNHAVVLYVHEGQMIPYREVIKNGAFDR